MSGYVKAGYSFLKNIIKPSKVSKDITSMPPTVAKTKKEKLLSQLNIKKQQVKGASARLKQTQFENKNPNFKGKDFTFATRVGRSSKVRENLKLGTKRKSNVDKIRKAFNSKDLGMQSVIYGLDKNKNITAADPKAKFIAAANKKKKKKKKVI